MGLSNTQRDAVLSTFRGTAKAAETGSTYIALLTTDASDETGTGLVEVSTSVWTNYARQPIANTTVGWTAPAQGTGAARKITNAAKVDFGTATISGAAPVIVAFAAYDAVSAGTFKGHGSLGSSQTINNGDPVYFSIGALELDA